jgi:Thioester domain
MRTRSIGLTLAFALALASTASGNAFFGADPQPGSMTFTGFSNDSVGATITGGSLSGVLAGQFQGYFDPAAEGDGAGYEADDFLRFFCIDINQFADTAANPYTRNLGVPDATNAAQLARLFDLYYPNKTTGTYYSGGATNFGSFADANSSAAFQLAVWEIWFDNDMNLSTGSFTASSTAAGQAQTYLDAVNAGSGTPEGWTFFTFTSPDKQDYLSAEYSVPLRTAPEPGTLILLCSAVLAAWATALHRRQTA